jgi:hypothetical protein
VTVRTLRDIFNEHRPARIDFMSVDVELHEKQVLAGNDWDAYRPRVVLVEATEPRRAVPLFETWEGILLSARYDFVHFDGLNRYYLRREDAALKERFTVGPNVFDNYIVSEIIDLHSRIRGLHQEIEDKEADLRHKNHELARIDNAFQRLNRHHQSMVEGTGGRSLRAGLWLARQMSKMVRVAGKARKTAS